MPKKHTLLVVDDEPEVVQSVQDLCRRQFRVLGATSAREAIDLLQKEEVHIIMTDQRMPSMTGVAFLSQVRGEHPDAVRLLFTGYADIKAVVDAINRGNVYRYIAKPWDPDELLALLRQSGEQYDLLVERKRLLADLKGKNQELERVNEELRRGGEMKEAFIRVASHELRTPLTILLGLTELARDTPDLPGPLPAWLERIAGAGQRLRQLVDQLCQLLQSGRFERAVERVPTDLAALLREAAETVRPFAQQRGQELAVDLSPELGSLAVEPGKLRDSVHHLLLNAIKFTPDGGRVELSAGPVGEEVEIAVRDNGVGIDPGHLPHVFAPFFTAFDVSRHTSGQFEFGRRGLGLGLTLVKSFVEMHGGHVTAQSQPGQGSTFTIHLPRSGHENPPAP